MARSRGRSQRVLRGKGVGAGANAKPFARGITQRSRARQGGDEQRSEWQDKYKEAKEELSLYERVMEASWQRFLFVSGSVAAAVTLVALNWDSIRRNFTDEMADVTSSALEHERVLTKTNELATAVAHHLLYDQKTQAALNKLVLDILRDPKTKDEVVVLVNKVLQDPEVLDEVSVLSNEVTNRVLADPGVNQHAQDVTGKLFNKVLAEKDLQNQAGTALWESFKYAVIPNWLQGDETETQLQGDETETQPQQTGESESMQDSQTRGAGVALQSDARLQATAREVGETGSKEAIVPSDAAVELSEAVSEAVSQSVGNETKNEEKVSLTEIESAGTETTDSPTSDSNELEAVAEPLREAGNTESVTTATMPIPVASLDDTISSGISRHETTPIKPIIASSTATTNATTNATTTTTTIAATTATTQPNPEAEPAFEPASAPPLPDLNASQGSKTPEPTLPRIGSPLPATGGSLLTAAPAVAMSPVAMSQAHASQYTPGQQPQ